MCSVAVACRLIDDRAHILQLRDKIVGGEAGWLYDFNITGHPEAKREVVRGLMTDYPENLESIDEYCWSQ